MISLSEISWLKLKYMSIYLLQIPYLLIWPNTCVIISYYETLPIIILHLFHLHCLLNRIPFFSHLCSLVYLLLQPFQEATSKEITPESMEKPSRLSCYCWYLHHHMMVMEADHRQICHSLCKKKSVFINKFCKDLNILL